MNGTSIHINVHPFILMVHILNQLNNYYMLLNRYKYGNYFNNVSYNYGIHPLYIPSPVAT